jgi:hypothetical protein
MEDGRWPQQVGGTTEMEESGRPCSDMVEMLVDGHLDVMENVVAARRIVRVLEAL